MKKKNLVLSIVSNYSWYKLEPFVTSFSCHNKAEDVDLVIFAADLSDFTRNIVKKMGGGRDRSLHVETRFRNWLLALD